ncbi:hypothetical protein FB565_006998 [Actinoplanes lutulentus]|uniref:PH (Pleckstrin Homology) domain-containing protein n=1 Tax=Actinoplanes lutulentus TaxID=1287878 RepID=A0A327ZC25_9ACTN|nr:hypothetical protein [Actinoplanes lutulentus]MBB2947230.1 hypothetical protein [Actinoplanes lutulentus]RAK36505.1 hypothetical protein B0I29_10894 [Actinoplanes lutulentus]
MPDDIPNLDTAAAAGGSPWGEDGPSRWPGFSFVLCALLAAIGLVTAVVTAIGGDLPRAAFLVGATIVMGHFAGWFYASRRYPRDINPQIARIDDGTPGVSFRYRTAMYYWTASNSVLMTLALIAIALALLPDSMVIAIVLLLLAAFPVLMAFALLRHAPGRLTLVPAGIYHSSIAFTYFAPWDTVREVGSSEFARTPLIAVAAMPSEATRIVRAAPHAIAGWEQRLFPVLAIQVPWLSSDPVAVYQTLRHYHENPEHRAELSSEAALDRVRQRRFLLRPDNR